MIFLIGGEKGGTGKTTLATNFAAIRSSEGRSVLLVDTDKQGSASAWAALRLESADLRPIPCVQLFGKTLAHQLRDLATRYDDLIVDAGGRDSVELRSAMVAADRLIVPIQASQFDVWTLEQMDTLVGQAAALNPGLIARIMINRASTNPRVREAEEARQLVDDFENLIYMHTVVRDRIAYRRAAASGRSVTEMDKPDANAISEMELGYKTLFVSTLEGNGAPR
jgi:chromosome partitioning protein